ncbi:MAG: energy transducer TonB [Desulfobacterales bacterium]|nr:energy transducer TonB [Desulfobacterales bacterium]
MQTGIIMRISLLVSFGLHLIMLFSFKQAFPLYWAAEDLRSYRVELIRPPVEDIDTDNTSATDIAKIEEEEKPPPQSEQDTISLDTEDRRYVTYARIIKERLIRHWRYPPEAKENLIEGRLMVLFTLGKEGNLVHVGILKSSGHDILDTEAGRAINAAAPFPPFPEHVSVKRLNIKASFDYRITARRNSDAP